MEHEIRALLLDAVIANVIERIGPDGDVLTLILASGDVVEISAERLRLAHYSRETFHG